MRERPDLAFAVAPPPAESDLRRLARAPHQPGRLDAAGDSAPSATVKEDLTAWVALLALLLLLLEALLAARFGAIRRFRFDR
jgi:hypothetical protein